MKRLAEMELQNWWQRQNRKPLIIRGARQVGKSTLVRQFCESQSLHLIELDLERYRNLNRVFASKDVVKITQELEALTGQSLRSPRSVLFLDEIQTTPEAIACLRYFYEDMPDLAVIAAGSLLEFVLFEHEFSMPVGRVEYLHLGPMTLQEFLMALNENHLLKYFYHPQNWFDIPETAHQKFLDRQREYLFVGGMPEAVLHFTQNKNLQEVKATHRSLLQTYQDDFTKYAKHSALNCLHRVYAQIPSFVGRKVKYSKISDLDRSGQTKMALELLIKARLLLPTFHSHCSGVPLKAGIDQKHYKCYFIDVGLLNAMMGLEWTDISQLNQRELINEGVLAEQFVAQHLAYFKKGLEPPELFYWIREGRKNNAEVDFVVAEGKKIIPIEVKAGKGGSLKSLQQFVALKNISEVYRFDLNLPSRQNLTHTIRFENSLKVVSFVLQSLPLYLVEKIRELLLSQ